jgi:hypothetical protein
MEKFLSTIRPDANKTFYDVGMEHWLWAHKPGIWRLLEQELVEYWVDGPHPDGKYRNTFFAPESGDAVVVEASAVCRRSSTAREATRARLPVPFVRTRRSILGRRLPIHSDSCHNQGPQKQH